MSTTSAALDTFSDTDGTTPDRPVTNSDLSDHLGSVMRRFDVTEQEIAFWWDCNRSFVSLVLANKRNLTDTLIEKLPNWVRIALHAEWAGTLKVLVGRKAALIAALEAITAMARDGEAVPRPAMLKADLPAAATKAAK